MSWNVVPDYYEGLKVVYEDHVPVRLRSVDKSERVENIQIRMSLGKSKEGRGVQVR